MRRLTNSRNLPIRCLLPKFDKRLWRRRLPRQRSHPNARRLELDEVKLLDMLHQPLHQPFQCHLSLQTGLVNRSLSDPDLSLDLLLGTRAYTEGVV